MSQELQQIGEIFKAAGKEALKQSVEQVLFKAIDNVVAQSPNKYDDMLLATFGPQLKEELMKLIEKI